MFSLSFYHWKVKPVDVSRAGIAIEKALFRLASPPHPNLLPDPDCCILSTTYAIAVGFFALQWSCEPGEQWVPSRCHCRFSNQKRTSRMRPSAYLRFVNVTTLLKLSVKQLASEEKFTKQECGRTQGGFLVWWLVGLGFFLPFIWLGLSILFSLLHASACHHGPVLLHMQLNKNKKKELPVLKWNFSLGWGRNCSGLKQRCEEHSTDAYTGGGSQQLSLLLGGECKTLDHSRAAKVNLEKS